ncbi:TIGR03279 family radical SAM protein [Gloeobacter kilaueensis]|uniref:Fe-S oxidoreductase n=1 Tax=Gloeobacter kilaueensis (strain ATCC BAA-2537 / CCAP 1431/1 / ULC 316 / JS1) TaxID=1183438 RepID=U5QNQ3_GLOK1|nr:TIGR03279 family radical SAM protein [Gloeobacter kilaueensis]AGY60508.1 Fe-S oxidoreductase [Gloeobacter kilaueensis JS1]
MENLRIKPALVTAIRTGSIAEQLGFEPGDRLVAINGTPPRDLIDYQFLCAEENLALTVLDGAGQTHQLEIEKDTDEDLGLEFATALFDGLIQCNNACPFCFIDQQPDFLRDTLHLKDDDYRLSFLYGSYLTLTNLPPAEWERIARLRLSPLFVSVHATEPELRARLLKNPRAAQILKQLEWFKKQRLQIHAQVVLCPGLNDGEHLERTILDLASFSPTVLSAAVVPVGLTRFRPGLDELRAVTPECAQQVIRQVHKLQRRLQRELDTRFVWLADEWYLLAKEAIPAARHYEGYPQLANGVGALRRFLDEFQRHTRHLPAALPAPRRYSWVVGTAVEGCFAPIVERLNQIAGLELRLLAVPSQFWGQQITVTGLLTGSDLLAALTEQDLGDALILPGLMLKEGQVFLDDLSVETLSERLGVPVRVVNGGATALLAALDVLRH